MLAALSAWGSPATMHAYHHLDTHFCDYHKRNWQHDVVCTLCKHHWRTQPTYHEQ